MSRPSDKKKQPKEGVRRISVSLPRKTFAQLDELVSGREFNSRSQAIQEMIESAYNRHVESDGNTIMTGVVYLVYLDTAGRTQAELSRLQRQSIDEVISSFRVQLEQDHTLEVVLLQGPAETLRLLANRMIAVRGVTSGDLHLTTTLLPPLHQRG